MSDQYKAFVISLHEQALVELRAINIEWYYQPALSISPVFVLSYSRETRNYSSRGQMPWCSPPMAHRTGLIHAAIISFVNKGVKTLHPTQDHVQKIIMRSEIMGRILRYEDVADILLPHLFAEALSQ